MIFGEFNRLKLTVFSLWFSERVLIH